MTQALPTITILRAGTFTDAGGQVVTFSENDLKDVVSSYDPANNPAPIVVGHPKLDDPAFGWVKGLAMVGGRVQATVEQIEPAFAEAVRAGRYRNVSASLYGPKAPSNPKPGRWYLRHIGFLGAAAPAIKGLGQVSFAAAEGGTIALPVALCRGVKARFNLPCGRVMECDSEELKARAQAIRDQHQGLSFADALLVACLDVALDDAVVSFGAHDPESEAGKRALTYRMKRAKLLSPGLSFSEAMEAAQSAGSVAFAAPGGYTISGDSMDLYRRAAALRDAQPGLGIADAAARIQRGH